MQKKLILIESFFFLSVIDSITQVDIFDSAEFNSSTINSR